MINSANGEQALSPEQLKDAAAAFWPQFKKKLSEALNAEPSKKSHRKDRDLLEEILALVRSLGNVRSQLIAETVAALSGSNPTSSWMRSQFFAPSLVPKFEWGGSPDFRWGYLQADLEKNQPPFWKLLSIATKVPQLGGGIAFVFRQQNKDVFEKFKPPSEEHEALRSACRSLRLKAILRCGDEEIVIDEVRLT